MTQVDDGTSEDEAALKKAAEDEATAKKAADEAGADSDNASPLPSKGRPRRKALTVGSVMQLKIDVENKCCCM